MDIFPFACLLYHLLTGGSHPYGEPLERDQNILQVRLEAPFCESRFQASPLKHP